MRSSTTTHPGLSALDLRVLQGVIRRELVLAIPPCHHIPPPTDLRAEQMLVCAALEGHVGPCDVDPAELGGDIYRVLMTAAFHARGRAGGTVTDADVSDAIAWLGYVLPELDRELQILRTETATCYRPLEYVARIQRLARQRRALLQTERASGLLRCVDVGHDEIIAALRIALDVLIGVTR